MVWKIAKTAAVMFAVGALLAVVAPAITVALGFAPDVAAAAATLGFNSQPLWLGSFFAAFGAIQATVSSFFDKVDGTSKKATAAQAKLDAHLNEPDAPCCQHALAPEKEVVAGYFRTQEDERRAAVAASPGAQLS